MSYKIDELLKIENPTESIIKLDSILNEQSNYGEKIEVLSYPEKVVLFVENLEREINNGGFNQFFFNSSGDFAEETLEALRVIGATKTAEIVARAYAEWPDSRIPKDRIKRQNNLEKIENKAENIWNECDNQFYDYEEDITSLLFKYVTANKNEFK